MKRRMIMTTNYKAIEEYTFAELMNSTVNAYLYEDTVSATEMYITKAIRNGTISVIKVRGYTNEEQ